ncbi:hypothetical protein KJY74_24720 [Klebsiella pneumoniae subsp. pneumoniae]|uniref:thioesterase II family protein n=1 Tax=Klebsiella pneumoniae TaxID=573 RepID=UPI0021B1D85F|nr:thioesterase domain-containing protein [Klebsiella pneumoniae]MCT6795040.1 hypothetical protein [Klebsiella pneumoniae subsp. pneumoniae]
MTTIDNDVLVCFPYAGGNHHSYDLLKRHMPPNVTVITLTYANCSPELTCRKHGKNNAFKSLLDHLNNSLSTLRGNITLFGHSMGALVAYEFALQCSEKINVGKLIVSGCLPPDLLVEKIISNGESDKILDNIIQRGGIPESIKNDPKRMCVIKSKLMHDVEILSSYRRSCYPKLNFSIHALSGNSDQLAPANEMRYWEDHTHCDFKINIFDGGHFYYRNNLKTIASLMQ